MVAEEALEGGGQRLFLKAHRTLACCSKCAWRACDAMRCDAGCGRRRTTKRQRAVVTFFGWAGFLAAFLRLPWAIGEQRARRQEAGVIAPFLRSC